MVGKIGIEIGTQKKDDAELGLLFVCRCHLRGLGEGRAKHRDEILSEGCGRTIRQPSNAVLAAGGDRHPFVVQGTDSEIRLIFVLHLSMNFHEQETITRSYFGANFFAPILILNQVFMDDSTLHNIIRCFVIK